MVAARLACTLAALQVGVFSNHVLPELVLPPGQLLFVTNDLFGAESAIWRQGDKKKVHMGCFLIHMHHGGDDSFSGLVLHKEAECFLKILPDFGQLLALEELRCSGEQHLYHPDTVLSGAASSGADLALSLSPVTLGWFDQVEVMLAAGEVNIGITGVSFFSAFVMGFDVGDLWPLVLGKAHDGVLWLAQWRPSFLAIQSY